MENFLKEKDSWIGHPGNVSQVYNMFLEALPALNLSLEDTRPPEQLNWTTISKKHRIYEKQARS
jgi:hypothetical protein